MLHLGVAAAVLVGGVDGDPTSLGRVAIENDHLRLEHVAAEPRARVVELDTKAPGQRCKAQLEDRMVNRRQRRREPKANSTARPGAVCRDQDPVLDHRHGAGPVHLELPPLPAAARPRGEQVVAVRRDRLGIVVDPIVQHVEPAAVKVKVRVGEPPCRRLDPPPLVERAAGGPPGERAVAGVVEAPARVRDRDADAASEVGVGPGVG